jgi:hypothetical protein
MNSSYTLVQAICIRLVRDLKGSNEEFSHKLMLSEMDESRTDAQWSEMRKKPRLYFSC